MIEAKTFEIRDAATFLPVIGIMIDSATAPPPDQYLMKRSGYGRPCLLLTRLAGGHSACDPYDWGNRTMVTAHQFISKNWTELESGALIDVEFIVGESTTPKVSERITDPIPTI